MVCPKCQRVVPDGADTCPNCNASMKPEKKKKKRVGCSIAAVIVVALFAIILVIAIASGDSSSDSPNTTDNTQAGAVQQNDDNAKLVYEDEYIKASFIKVYDDELVDLTTNGVSYMQLLVENKCDKSFTVGFTNAALNGMSTTFGSALPVTILPGNSSKQPFILFTTNTGINSAEEINKIQFQFYLLNENGHALDQTETITINVK